MGYCWVFLGDGEIPKSSLEAWLARPADPAIDSAALDASVRAKFGLDDDSEAEVLSVREVLSQIAHTSEVHRISHDGPICLRVLAAKDSDAWLTWRPHLVAAFASLAAYGGKGRLVVVGDDVGPDEGFRLEVEQFARLTRLDAQGVAEARRSAGYREVEALTAAAFPASALRNSAAPVPPPPGSYLNHAMRTIAERALYDARDGLRRIERRVLRVLHSAGPSSKTALLELVKKRHPEQTNIEEALPGVVERRTAALSLIDERDGTHALSAMAFEALDTAPDAAALSMPIPWLLVAGGRAIAVGLDCNVPPFSPRAVLEAALERLAIPPRPLSALRLTSPAPVLVDGSPAVLDAAGLLDAFLAHCRETLGRRSIADVDERIEAELRRWLDVR